MRLMIRLGPFHLVKIDNEELLPKNYKLNIYTVYILELKITLKNWR